MNAERRGVVGDGSPTMLTVKLSRDEVLALLYLAGNSADDGLDEFFSATPEYVEPAASAMEKLREVVRRG